MNTANCADGWATDEVFSLLAGPASCQVPLAAWIVLGLVLCTGKAFVVFKHVTLWRRRAQRLRKAAVGANVERRPVPFVPSLGILSFVTYTTFFLLTGLNVANARNGWAGALYSLGWFAFGAMSIFYFLKMLRLGKRLIPLSKKIVNPGAIIQFKGDDLGKFDALGRVLFFVECSAVMVQFIIFAIVGVVRGEDANVVLGALGVMAGFLLVHTMSVLWLVERTVSAIKQSHFKSSDTDGNQNPAPGVGMRSDLQSIIRKMREQQLIIMALASSGGLVYILILTGAIPLNWYIMLIHMFYDLVANLVIVFSMARRQRKQRAHEPRSPQQQQQNSPVDVTQQTPTDRLSERSKTPFQREVTDNMDARQSGMDLTRTPNHAKMDEGTEMNMVIVYLSNAEDVDA